MIFDDFFSFLSLFCFSSSRKPRPQRKYHQQNEERCQLRGGREPRVDLEVSRGRGLADEVSGDAGVEAFVRRLHLLDDVHVRVAGG